MLGNDPFYFSIIRKMTAAFGTVFNDIVVPRFDDNGAVNELVRVPISYAAKERVLVKVLDDPDIAKQSAVSPLPRISFQMNAPVLDSTRMINPVQNMALLKSTSGNYKRQMEAVPYNFPISLWVYTKTIEDGNKIIEQILPMFRPELPLKVELIPEMGITMNIPLILNNTSVQDTYEGDFKGDRRAIIWQLDFTMKGYMFGPIRESKIIKFANVNFYAPSVSDLTTAVGNSTPIDRVTSQPGLTANGQPTTNVALTIPYVQINADDNWAYINIIYGNLDPSEGTGGNQSNNLPTVG